MLQIYIYSPITSSDKTCGARNGGSPLLTYWVRGPIPALATFPPPLPPHPFFPLFCPCRIFALPIARLTRALSYSFTSVLVSGLLPILLFEQSTHVSNTCLFFTHLFNKSFNARSTCQIQGQLHCELNKSYPRTSTFHQVVSPTTKEHQNSIKSSVQRPTWPRRLSCRHLSPRPLAGLQQDSAGKTFSPTRHITNHWLTHNKRQDGVLWISPARFACRFTPTLSSCQWHPLRPPRL